MVDQSRHPLLNVGWLKNPVLQHRHARLWVMLALLGAGTSLLFPGGWPVALAFYTFGAARIWHRGLRSVAWMLAMSPLVQVPVASTIVGCVGYATGTAVLMGPRCNMAGTVRVDPVTRVPLRPTGCHQDGSQVFTLWPNNAAVRVLSAVFGPMRGAYQGTFPTSAQATRLLLEEGVQVDAWDVEKGEVQLGQELVRFPPVAVASGDVNGFSHPHTLVAHPEPGLVVVGQVEGDGAVLVAHIMDVNAGRELAQWRSRLLPEEASKLLAWHTR